MKRSLSTRRITKIYFSNDRRTKPFSAASPKPSLLFVLLFLFVAETTEAQHIFSKTRFTAQYNILVSAGKANPFWIQANRYGEVPDASGVFSVGGSAKKEYDTLYSASTLRMRKFSYGYGARAVVNTGMVNEILLPEAYIKLRYGIFEFYAGRRQEVSGLADSALSSGSFIWSGNAMPLPKIQISIPNYVSVLGKGLLSIKGTYAHGWFGSADSVKNYYLHQKSLYVRVGKPSWRLKLHGGFNHQVQWGGKPAVPFIDRLSQQPVSYFPSDFNTYVKVVTGVSLNKDSKGTDQPGVPANEALNRAGNHLGTVDIALEWDGPKNTILIYRQSIYEDGSLYYLSNIQDGLLGLSFKIKNKKSILQCLVLEYLNTTNQGGKLTAEEGYTTPQLMGRDNYFNNSLYKDGWTYKNNVIGTPFIVPFYKIAGNYPLSAKKEINSNFSANNRVEAIHLGGTYKVKGLRLLTRLAATRNIGSYAFPVPEKIQYSFLQNVRYKFGKYELDLSLAYDSQGIFTENFGVNMGVRRSWIY